MNIVSPFLRTNAIKSDAIVFNQAILKKTMTIYTDPTLKKPYFKEFLMAKDMLSNAGAEVVQQMSRTAMTF